MSPRRHHRAAPWACAVVVALALASPANAATFTVNSTGDGADANPGNGVCATAGSVCTLRAAIDEANSASGADTIAFAISGAGPHTITLAAALDAALYETHIDCATQSGTVCCSGLDCSAAAWKIVIDRANGTDGSLNLTGANSSVNGCEVKRVAGSSTAGYALRLQGNSATATCNYVHDSWGGIVVSGTGSTIGGVASDDANRATGNHFGLTLTGSTSTVRGNVATGNVVGIYAEGGTGSTATGNLASANTEQGIFVKDTSVVSATLSSNLVGVALDGVTNDCNFAGDGTKQITDNGTSTTLTGNTLGCQPTPTPTPHPGCCNMTGLEGFGVTCFDYTLGSVLSQADCEAFGGTAVDYNPNAVCDPDFGGVCPGAPTPTPTPGGASGGAQLTPMVLVPAALNPQTLTAQ